MYKILEHKQLLCTGCGACVNQCPTNAIKYRYRTETDGSMVAEIDHSLCIECGACEKVCPVLNDFENTNQKAEDCYAVWAEDEIRKISSSGGIFTVLAEYFLTIGGVVCAVAYGENFKAKHIIVTKKEELALLRRSKYYQSEIGYIYREIKELLKEKKVLFVGTPCQVAGLRAYLKQEQDGLFCIDIYCNYTPSYQLFQKYLEENYDVNDIKKIDFRVKSQGWICDIHQITYQDGETEEKREYNDMFQRGYHPRLFLRRTCEQCKFAGSPRQGDLSIADFWHIGEFYPEYDDKKGTSCCVINNKKGQKLFEHVKNQLKLCEKVSIDCMKYNRGASVQAHPHRDRFYKLLKEYSFNKAVDYALNEKYDLAIWGNWSEKNYGSELTYYALYCVIEKMGIHPIMIERPRNVSWAPNERPVLFYENPYPKEALHELYPDKISMYELNEKCETFLIGSDQLWHRDLYEPFGKVAFFDYIYNDKKKIAYAASFGREYWSGDEKEAQEAAYYLKDFDYISVREQSGVAVCKERFGVDAVCNLDPVFLCEKEVYRELAKKSQLRTPESYVGAYLLDINETKLRILDAVSGEKQKIVITDAFTEEDMPKWDMYQIYQNAYCEDWLKNIIESDFVVTDSFHGMCFAIIFHKQFIAIANPGRGTVRFIDLLKKLGLTDRLILMEKNTTVEYGKLQYKNIEYDKVDAILEQERETSIQWLVHALNAPKDFTMSKSDLLQKKQQEYEYQANQEIRALQESEHEFRDRIGGCKWDISVHRKEIDELRRQLQEEKGGREWDIKVHRKEIDELRRQLQEEKGGREWDIKVHRQEIDELKQIVEEQRRLLEGQQSVLEEQKEMIQEHDRLIDEINRSWLMRGAGKVSKVFKRK